MRPARQETLISSGNPDKLAFWPGPGVIREVDTVSARSRKARKVAARPSSPAARTSRSSSPSTGTGQAGAAGDALARVARAAEAEQLARRRLVDEVAAARRAGAIWADVAGAIGVTPQSAHGRFASKIR